MRRIMAVLSTALLTAVLLVTPAGPASAAVGDCPTPVSGIANLCLFEAAPYNYGSGFFRRASSDIQSPPNGTCMNINTFYWHDYVGTVGDAASSLVINSVPGSTWPSGLDFEFYEWINCNESGRSFKIGMGGLNDVSYIPYLSNITNINGNLWPGYEGTNFDNTIQSVRVGGPGS